MLPLFWFYLELNFFTVLLNGSNQTTESATVINQNKVDSDAEGPKLSLAPKSYSMMLPEANTIFRNNLIAQEWSISSIYQALRNLLVHPQSEAIFSDHPGPINTLSKRFLLLSNHLYFSILSPLSCLCDYHINILHQIHAKYRKNPEFWIFYGVTLGVKWPREVKKKLSIYLYPLKKIHITKKDVKNCLNSILEAKKFIKSKMEEQGKNNDHYVTLEHIFEAAFDLLDNHHAELEKEFENYFEIK
jgi:hypothetical protein